MNILLASMTRPHHGGVRNHLNNLARGLSAAGSDVRICTPLGCSDRFPVRASFSEGLSTGMRAVPGLAPLLYASAKGVLGLRLGRSLARRPADVVNARDVGAFNACHSLCRRRGIPLVLNLHGCLAADLASKGLVSPGGPAHRYFGREERRAYERSTHTAAVGPQERDRVLELAPGRRNAIPVIYNLVDSGAFRPDPEGGRMIRKSLGIPDRAFVPLYAGRLSRRKGVDVLLRAFARLARRKLGETRLLVAGAGAERSRLEEVARKEGIGEMTLFTGIVHHDELNSFYNAADVVVVPSVEHGGYTEGTPTVALEAMAAQRALVVTPLGGLGEIVRHGENGLIVEEGSSDSLGEALARLAGDAGLRDRLAAAGREYAVGHRSLERVAALWLGIYRRAVEGRPLTDCMGG